MSDFNKTTITHHNYTKVTNETRKIALSRNTNYGNSIDLCSDVTLMELVQMKLERNKTLKPNDPKYNDELQDSINYLIYILIRQDSRSQL